MKCKHITIINQYIGSPHHGMEYRHYFLAKNLIELGYKVTLVTGSYSHLFTTLPIVDKNFKEETIDGINYIWVKLPKYGSSKSIGRIWNMFYFSWKLRSLDMLKPSYILLSSPSLFPVKLAYKWAKKFHTKFLFEVRDIWPLTLTEMSGLSPSHPLIKLMEHYEKFAYKNADKIISLLPTAEEYFVKQGMCQDKFVYLPNGIETRKEKLLPLSLCILEKIPENKFIIAYAGTIGIANNLQYMIEVAYELKEYHDIHFIILGQGGEKERLQVKVSDIGLDNVTFLEPIKKEMVKSFLEKVDVSFISLLPEKLFRFGVSPNKVFDYMYAKKPIIWAIEAGNNLVEESGCGISVPLNKIQKLKGAVLELKSLPKEKLEELGQNGYNFVNTHHTYMLLVKKLIKIIEE